MARRRSAIVDASAECIPPLGTVHIPRWEMGRQAGLMVAQALAGERTTARRIDPVAVTVTIAARS